MPMEVHGGLSPGEGSGMDGRLLSDMGAEAMRTRVLELVRQLMDGHPPSADGITWRACLLEVHRRVNEARLDVGARP